MLGVSIGDVPGTSLSLVHYDEMAGLNPHVDTVHIFNATLGPIFTVAMGESEKMLDMLPVLLPTDVLPFRIFTDPNEMMIMDGEYRILWAHAKPWKYDHEQFTLVFKLPELKKKLKTTSFAFEDVNIEIPSYIS